MNEAMMVTDTGVWFTRPSWPLHKDESYPHATTSENGIEMVVDQARPGDDLCEVTTGMRHGLETYQAVCIMPKGHDSPHMPQSPLRVAAGGRLFIRLLRAASPIAGADQEA